MCSAQDLPSYSAVMKPCSLLRKTLPRVPFFYHRLLILTLNIYLTVLVFSLQVAICGTRVMALLRYLVTSYANYSLFGMLDNVLVNVVAFH